MEKHEAINEVLNDLVKINNDRIAGYERAINESKDLDIDLKATFDGMIRQSNQFKRELTDKILRHEGAVEDETTTTGNIYRAWMDIKSTFTDSDRHSILEACEFGEDATQRAYDAALTADGLTDPDLRNLITEQQAELKKSHDLIKSQREAHQLLKQ